MKREDWKYLVNYAVPSVACVVDDDVNLSLAELGGFLDELVEVCVIEHISGDGEGFATALVDGVGDLLCFGCGCCVSIVARFTRLCYCRGILSQCNAMEDD